MLIFFAKLQQMFVLVLYKGKCRNNGCFVLNANTWTLFSN